MTDPAILETHTLDLLLSLTSDGTLPDLPPGWEVSSGCNDVWYVCFGGDSWDDEFGASTREGARAECWRRFCEAEPKWADLLAQPAIETLERLLEPDWDTYG